MAGTSTDIRSRLNKLFTQLGEGLYERELETKLCILAAIAGESVFLLGPPGTGKSLLARRIRFAFSDAKSFDYLMGRFSTPEEIFGPVSIAKLRDEDKYLRQTTGYLPDADIVFLDEIWKASPPIQNALLTALNERIFRNGDREMELPLKLLIGASNEYSGEEPAFWDRFLIRLKVGPLKEKPSLTALLSSTEDLYRDTVEAGLKIDGGTWDTWKQAVDAVRLSPATIEAIVLLRTGLSAIENKHAVSDRRWKKIARVIRTAAFCNGRQETSLLDLPVAEHCVWDRPDERPTAAGVLKAAIAQAAGTFDGAATLSLETDSFLSGLNGALQNEGFETVLEPLVVDEEYFMFDRFGSYARDGDFEFRIWKHDAEEMSRTSGNSDGSSEKTIDIFVYQAGRYIETIARRIEKSSRQYRYRIDGLEFDLKLAETRKRIAGKRTLTAAERESWKMRADELKGSIDDAATRIMRELSELKANSPQELFCPPEYSQILSEALVASVETLGTLSARLQADCEKAGIV